MVTPRQYSDYPIEYSELFRRAMNRSIRMTFPSKSQAKRLRSYLYAFRESIRDGINVPDDLVVKAPLISFVVDGITLIIHRPKRPPPIRKAPDNGPPTE